MESPQRSIAFVPSQRGLGVMAGVKLLRVKLFRFKKNNTVLNYAGFSITALHLSQVRFLSSL